MNDAIPIGSTPIEEHCVAVGSADYEGPMRDECEVFKRMLLRLYPPPAGSTGFLRVKRNSHDFGAYYEVEAVFDRKDVTAAQWAFELESNSPERWDDIAAFELQWIHRGRAIERAEQRPRAVSFQWPAVPQGLALSELLRLHPLPEPKL